MLCLLRDVIINDELNYDKTIMGAGMTVEIDKTGIKKRNYSVVRVAEAKFLVGCVYRLTDEMFLTAVQHTNCETLADIVKAMFNMGQIS